MGPPVVDLAKENEPFGARTQHTSRLSFRARAQRGSSDSNHNPGLMDSGLDAHAPKSAVADLGTIKCRSRVNPRSMARNDGRPVASPYSTMLWRRLLPRFTINPWRNA